MRRTPLEAAIASQTDRKVRYEAKRRKTGEVRVAVWVPASKTEDLKAYAAKLRNQVASETPAPPLFAAPEKGKHPKDDELAFMIWHFERFPTMEAVGRITRATGRAQSMVMKHHSRWEEGREDG